MPELSFINKKAALSQLEAGQTLTAVLKSSLIKASEDMNLAFRTGRPATDLVHARANAVDCCLQIAWDRLGLNQEAASLIAVGGYGRGELHPHSDIDVLILLDTETSVSLNSKLEQFVTLLWDISLDVGHSVRTVAECAEQAAKDITVVTNIMESRTLTGSEELRQQMLQATSSKHMWSSRQFYSAKWEEQIIRHKKFANTEYNLEPNIKNGPGSLRDIQMISWIAQRHFDCSHKDSLADFGLLTTEEMSLLNRGREYLWRIR
ncbi:MAG: nucleotidyltransferase domain-containing protein, partial [Pseudomonadales bacterium]